MILQQLQNLQLINPPQWVLGNVQYLILAGSHLYGCHTEDSDKDYVGYLVPTKELLFPFKDGGKIYGYDNVQNFEQYLEKSKNHKDYPSSDITLYSIVKIFKLMRDGNPNAVEILFAPRNCILHTTKIAEMVREKRYLFLSKKIYHTHRGYSFNQLGKAKAKNPEPDSKRAKLREIYGVDTKYLYNVFRILSQCEQYLTIGDLDIQRDSDIYKSIRRGEWSLETMDQYFQDKEKYLTKLYEESAVLPHKPDDVGIKSLLLNCLEEWYGNIDDCVKILGKEALAIQQIKEIVGKL